LTKFRIASLLRNSSDLRHRSDGRRQRAGSEHRLAAALEPLFRARDHFDHAFVGFAGIGAECEDTVLVEDQSFDLRVLREHGGGLFRQIEP
jgi:hypothetical protein